MEEESLYRLARAGDVERIRAFLAGQIDASDQINQPDEEGFTALYYAVTSEKSSAAAVELLLEAGADPNSKRVAKPQGSLKIPGFPRFPKQTAETVESVLKEALGRGDLKIIKLLQVHGVDFTYVDPSGYTALIHAVFGPGNRLPLIQFLIGLGAEVNGVTSYGESAVKVTYHAGKFDIVKELLKAGADESSLCWTSLIKAVAIGSIEEIRRELSQPHDLRARDFWDANALHVACLRGDKQIVEVLLQNGADLTIRGQMERTCLSYATESTSVELVTFLIEKGCRADEVTRWGRTCICEAAERGDLAMVECLLSLGANPDAPMKYTTALEAAHDAEIIRTLLRGGADPGGLNHDARRMLLGYVYRDADALFTVTEEQYQLEKLPRQGNANPEEIKNPFWQAMIRAGVNAYLARRHFGDLENRAADSRTNAIWCADRFGQSVTPMPDGRIILIAGEHEDHYDPDFYIYNDVWEWSPDGEIRIFGYPYSVFPPTDFHSATLVDPFIYIVGSLGYPNQQRQRGTPVYRLDTRDFHMEQIQTGGDEPGRIWGQRATLIEEHIIRVEINEKRNKRQGTYELDLQTMIWSELQVSRSPKLK